MAVLTNFLKLLKPEKNDYVDVDKHISENYDKIDSKMQELNTSNSGKLDKGAVSSEYDTAKKIEDKIKEAKNTADNKLDKGSVPEKYNTAEKIVNELNLKQNELDNSLKTNSKKVSDSINEIYDNRWRVISKSFGSTSTITDLNDIKELGYYTCSSAGCKFINKPTEITIGSIELFVTGAAEGIYVTQYIKDRSRSNRMWIRTFDDGWSEWSEIAKAENLWKIRAKHIGNQSSYSDLNDLIEAGNYVSVSSGNKWHNTPKHLQSGGFMLEVRRLTDVYIKQSLTDYYTGVRYERTYHPTYQWTKWFTVLTDYNSKDSANAFTKSLGVVYGFIQDDGVKKKDYIYYDNVTMQPYICLRENSDISVTNNFLPMSQTLLQQRIENTLRIKKKVTVNKNYMDNVIIDLGVDYREYSIMTIRAYEPEPQGGDAFCAVQLYHTSSISTSDYYYFASVNGMDFYFIMTDFSHIKFKAGGHTEKILEISFI